jgi:hypothetical protein
MSSRSLIRILFLAVSAAQPLQWLFIAKFGEPFPAVTMPSFALAGPSDSEPFEATTIDMTVHFQDGPDAELSPHELLAQCPVSHYAAILRENFTYDRFAAPVTLPTVTRRNTAGAFTLMMRRWLAGLALMAGSGSGRSSVAPMIPWLSQRLKQLYPDRKPIALTLRWYAEVFSVDRESQVCTHTRELKHEHTVECAQ